MSAVKVTFDMLYERFVSGLSNRLSHLDDCLETLAGFSSNETTVAVLTEMTRAFHSLAGIGGTYGFHQITEVARSGEAFCRSIVLPPTRKDLKVLGSAIDSLRLAASPAANGTNVVRGTFSGFADSR